MRAIDFIINLCAGVAAALLLVITLVICYSVVVRFVFADPLAWVTEVTEYTLLLVTFLGAPWLLKHGGHVRVDVLLNAFSPKLRAIFETINYLLGSLISATVTWYSFLTVLDHYRRNIYVINTLEIKKYLLLSIIPLGCSLLTIQFLRLGYSRYKTIPDSGRE